MKAKLEEIIDALDFADDMTDYYYNPKSGEVFSSNDYADLSVDELDALYGESIILPSRYEINEYGMMEDFVDTISDDKLRKQLQITINGKGAFRRFKDTCIVLDIINDWYKYRENRYREFAIEWCNNHEIPYEE